MIRAVSLLSDAAAPGLRGVCAALGEPVSFVEDVPWQEREKLLDTGEAQLAFMCGLLWMRKRAAGAKLGALAAPVPAPPRYGGRPIYFSDVVVRRDSGFSSFADLRGKTFAYNEPGSYSGYAVMKHHLATLGERTKFFGRVIESGSHLASIARVLDGDADAAAIDTTVLDLADPSLVAKLRAVAELGPSPIPPVVAAESLGAERLERLRAALRGLHQTPEGRATLAGAGLSCYVACRASDYQVLVERAELGKDVVL